MTKNIKLRSKFQNLLTETEQSNISNILSAFERFCQKENDEALSILWHLTYHVPYASSVFNIFGLDCESIPAIQLRNEMRYQYNTIHPGFLDIETKSQEIQEAYDALKNKADVIVSNVVYQQCFSNVFLAEDEISRIIFLLYSSNENYFFGGIRALGFDMDESTYLKQFHEEIGNLFKALCDEHQSNKNLPFKDVQQLITVTSAEASVEDQAEVPLSTMSFKPLTAEEILKNEDDFICFVKSNNLFYLEVLGKAGFDLNEVMAKRAEISNLIDAIEALKK